MAKSRKQRKNQPSPQKGKARTQTSKPVVETKQSTETATLTKKIEKPAPPKASPQKTTSSSTDAAMPFGQMNYFIMIAGILLLLLGFYIMASDKETFGFGFYGLTLGPIIVFVSFMIQFFAIFYKKKG